MTFHGNTIVAPVKPERFLRKFPLLALGFCLPFAGRLSATDYYVDPAATGAANGTSWANAWTSFTTVAWGTAANQVGPGDTLYISGGSTSKDYGATSFTVGASGASDAARVTIRVGQDAGHNGTAIFDYDSRGDSATTNGLTCSRNYVTIDGSVGGVAKLSIRNLRHTTDRNACYAIYGTGAVGVIIQGVDIRNCSNGIRLQYGSSNKVARCNLVQMRGDAAISFVSGGVQEWDTSIVEDNVIECLANTSTKYGPDGVQSCHGMTIRRNQFSCTITALATSSQHTDYIQAQGNFLKIYGNRFTNIGDSGVDYDTYANANPHDVWICNNIFEITTPIDPYPEYIRFYTSSTAVASFTNIKIFGNLFANNTVWSPVKINGFGGGNPTATGCEIKNNIWYQCGNGNYFPMLFVAPSTAFTAADWDTDANIFYRSSGTQYVAVDASNAPATTTAASWVSANEPNGSTAAPGFINAAAGNYLPSEGALQVDRGVSLTSYYAIDFVSTARPQGSAFDIGPYEYQSAGDATVPTISITSPTSLPTYETTSTTITIAGVAADDVAVSSVTWSNSRGGSGTATGTTSWSQASIALYSGTNVLTVTATDSSNNTASATLTVYCTPVAASVTAPSNLFFLP